MQERRKYRRLATTVDVAYSKTQPKSKEKQVYSKNISKGGICLIINEEVQVSDLLELKIFLPRHEAPINVIGEVHWVRESIIGGTYGGKKYDVGIEFKKISEQDVNEIEKYVFSAFEECA